MSYPYERLAYTDRPIQRSYWPTTVEHPVPAQVLDGSARCDFAVLGGGYCGLVAALTLAEAGADVVLLEGKRPGWGASGRNGGLVSAGSAKLSDAVIRRRYGEAEAQAFFDAERAAIGLVEKRIERHGLEVDRQSDGYTFAAHSPRMTKAVQAYGESYGARYGLGHEVLSRREMAERGMASPSLHAAVNLPLGFAVNPMKLALGLTRAATAAGARVFHESPVLRIGNDGAYLLHTPRGRVRARTLLLAFNGYAGDRLVSALGGRFLPVQSNILVTRTMTEDEIAAQGWWSAQMVVDSRNLLHYFRLLPERRMLFGLRGSVRCSERSLARTEARARADFDRMFPAWRDVETPFFWSGLICISRRLVPFAGPVPGMERAFAAFGFHGSGVAMAPYAGALLADMALGRARLPHPGFMKAAPARFGLGRWRRALLPLAFGWYRAKDAL